MNNNKKSYPFINVEVIVLLVLFFILSAERVSGQSMKSLIIFRPGDAVEIVVWEYLYEQKRNLNFSGHYSINPEGFIALPLVGDIKVKGLTLKEVTEVLKERFGEHFESPYIYVRPLIRITMQGAFVKPGSYRIDPSKSLWDLIDVAGGPEKDCNLEKLRVERGGEVVIENLLHAYEKGYSLEEIGVESGDQIIAKAKSPITIAFVFSIINLCASLILIYLRLKRGY